MACRRDWAAEPSLGFGTSTGFGGGFVPKGLNDNRQGLQPHSHQGKPFLSANGAPSYQPGATPQEKKKIMFQP